MSNYCGIVFVGGGSSWAYNSNRDEAVKRAVKQAKRDWKDYHSFGETIKVVLIDMTNRNGWYADYSGIFEYETKEEITDFEVVTVQA
jgi:hypothetical protein